MLEIRPTCENCNIALPPSSTDAMICSYECTFCKHCVDTVLENVCPNCGGGFCHRPVRPARNLRNDNYLGKHPASGVVVFKPVDVEQHRAFSSSVKQVLPNAR
ncbi:DUF1272 domain-containing protein [Pseudohalioglobus lutimaris]|uniref:DUF1272 domain-containing protein n=1 Tax=Pseudohalioglobus lutimaris TaxID=1737061 RepID=A0A2N5WXW4_9GAMM|nr:DUF1272 domain-containing protein [Pseudohalioglobus lutimaris]PLW67081.1 DUF1272 domain-containing protein [Pseudohalioglobus lutimaris]